MSGADDNLQRALFTALTDNAPLMALVEGVYADVDQPDDAEDPSAFPYISFGQDTMTANDTKTTDGISALCQIDVWSRANNYLEAKQIGAAIRTALHHQDLTITGANHIITLFESADYMIDEDGQTKHGICLVRVRFDII